MALITSSIHPVLRHAPQREQLAEGIAGIPPRPHHALLLDYLQQTWPELEFRHQISRSGWHRSGGVVSASGDRISDELEHWLQQRLSASGDFEQLLVDLEQQQPRVTRYNGATHFFAARFREQPAAFWQLEVEELQEVMDRHLLNSDTAPPDDLSGLLEPLQPASLEAQPLGPPRYRLGNVMNVHQVLAEATNQPVLQRFFREWLDERTDGSDFERLWFFQRSESLTRYGVNELRLQPRAIKARQLGSLSWDLHQDARGLALQLRAYDRIAGYGGAWYFGLVAGNLVPRELPARLEEDWQEGYRYIPDRQHQLVRGWLHQPYTL